MRSAPRWRRAEMGFVAILLFAIASRLAYLLVYRAQDPLYGYLLHDASRYHAWATALARGEAWEPGAFHQAPLYPYLLSLLYRFSGPSPLAAYVLQSLSGVAVVLLVRRIAARAYGRRAGLFAMGLASLYGVLHFNETKLLPAALTVLLAALLLDRLQHADASPGARVWIQPGLLLGAGALAHPSFLLLAPLLLAWAATGRARPARQKLVRAGFFAASAALVVLPVTVRNYRASGDAVLVSANAGISFYQGNNPGAEGVFSTPRGFTGSIFTQRQESRQLAEQSAGRPLSDAEVSRFWFGKGLEFIRQNPGRFLRLEGRKLLLALGNREQPLEYNAHIDPNPVRYLVPLPFALVLALAFARFVAGPKITRVEAPLLLFLCAQLATLLLFYVSSRYRLVVMPALLATAGAGASVLFDGFRRGAGGAFLPWGAALAAGLVSFLALPSSFAVVVAHQDAMSLSDRAEAHLHGGDAAQAIALYQRAIVLDPHYAFAYLDLAQARLATGDAAGAEREIRQTLRLAPGLAEAHGDLGVLLLRQDRLAEAANAFAEAFRLDAGNVQAANNLLGTSLRLGRRTVAIRTWRLMLERQLPVKPELEARIRTLGPAVRGVPSAPPKP